MAGAGGVNRGPWRIMDQGEARAPRVLLSLLPPSRGQRALALAVLLLSLLVFLACVPFAKAPLGRIDAFIPAYQAALAINDLITAALLFGQFSILRARGLLLLACGYLFTAAMVVVHTLSFPGLFAPTGLLGAGPQSTAWLYMLWHGGFPLMVIAYALVMPTAHAELQRGVGTTRMPILAGIAVVAVAVAVLGSLATVGHDLLPPLMRGNQFTTMQVVVINTVWLLSAAAVPLLWRRKPHSVLDLWLMVVMLAWVFDIGLSGVFNAARFDLGFYAGRLYGLAAASVVLIVIVLETRTLYARLATTLAEARDAADRRAAELAQMNATLEQRVAERTRALEAEIAERERAQEAMRESQKMEVIGRMAGGIAHDLNNLLTVVQGNAELLQGRVGEDRDKRAAQAIDRAVMRGARLIRQLMVFSRRQAASTEILHLPGRGTELADLLTRSLRGDIRLVLDLPDELWLIECDAGELELALLNLCVNARDAMPDGGLVRIEARNRELGPGEVPRLGGAFVALSVTDSGGGIAPEALTHVFEPFFTTKEIGKGTGLGLAQVHGFAEQSGGRATIASTLGQGTTVTLYLPRATAQATARAAEIRPAAMPGSGTVLIVEDDDDVAQVAIRMFGMLGYIAHHARDARTALSLLLGGQRFVLLFSDIMMPGGMNGMDLARRVRQHFPWLPVLLTSGYHRATAEVDREGFSVIAKPYRVDALSDAVQRCLAEAQQSAHIA
jgi:signal transduction histidine kinase/CheY-like chemotaxis protein